MRCLDLTEVWGGHDLTLLSCAYAESASSLNVRFKDTAYSLLVPSSDFVSNPIFELEKEPTALGSRWLRLRMGSMVCMFTPVRQHGFPNRTRILVFVCCEPYFSSPWGGAFMPRSLGRTRLVIP